MRLIYAIYYRFNAWRYGKLFGCGRCHHAYNYHRPDDSYASVPCRARNCPCKEYHIGLTTSHDIKVSGGTAK
jgi:hypothetical protein